MADLPGCATRGFRFNKAYKIRVLVVVPRDGVIIVSKRSLHCVFLHVGLCLGSGEKGNVTKCGFARCAPQKDLGVLKHGAEMVVTHQWELSMLGREILEL